MTKTQTANENIVTLLFKSFMTDKMKTIGLKVERK